MATDLTPGEVSRWLRAQAQSLLDAADVLDRTFHIASIPNGHAREPGTVSEADIAHVKEMLGNRKMRRAELIERLGLDVGTFDEILTEENGFERSENGWYTVKS